MVWFDEDDISAVSALIRNSRAMSYLAVSLLLLLMNSIACAFSLRICFSSILPLPDPPPPTNTCGLPCISAPSDCL